MQLLCNALQSLVTRYLAYHLLPVLATGIILCEQGISRLPTQYAHRRHKVHSLRPATTCHVEQRQGAPDIDGMESCGDTHSNTHTHTHTHAYMHTRKHTHTHMHTCTHTHTHIHTHRTHIHTIARKHTCTRTHTHAHTNTSKQK